MRRWPAVALATGIALAGGAAAGYAVTRPPGHDYGVVPAASAAAAPADRAAAAAPADRAVPAASSRSGKDGGPAVTITAVPVRLKIPLIGVDAQVIPVGVAAGGALGIPASPSVVGWWAGGGAPGQPSGATVLVGHVDSAASGPGALFRLRDIRPGAAVSVIAGRQAWRYVVRAVRAYAKAALPAAAVFGQQVTPRLVIITCGGPFDAAAGHYLDNIVAWAVPG